MDLDQIRREYQGKPLDSQDLTAQPLSLFKSWVQQAVDSEIPDATAMVLATVDSQGQPSQRTVLLKHADEKGLIFYTNLESRKAKEISENSKVSVHFPWHTIHRQVKICGTAEPLSSAEVLKYFLTRPRDSQIAATISPQSKSIESRQFLLQQFDDLKEKLMNKEVPLPSFWGGYRIKPVEFEFWQGQENRLHDRFVYRWQQEAWMTERLAP